MMFERRTASHRLICNLHMQSVAVGVGIDRDRRGCRAVAPSPDAAGDFTPVGDEQSANMVEDPGSFRGSLEPLQPGSAVEAFAGPCGPCSDLWLPPPPRRARRAQVPGEHLLQNRLVRV